MKKYLSNKGFTLLEFLIAAGVLFLALGLAIQAGIYIRNSNELSNEIVTAMEDAHRAIERMRQQSTLGNFPGNVVSLFPPDVPISVDDPFADPV